MKAISLWQPWATLIAIGAKVYETRSWSTSHRGLLAIHAAKTTKALDHFYRMSIYNALRHEGLTERSDLPLGAVLCVVRLTGVYSTDCMDYPSKPNWDFGDYSPGRYAWKLELVQVFDEPIPARGAQGLWNWEGVGL